MIRRFALAVALLTLPGPGLLAAPPVIACCGEQDVPSCCCAAESPSGPAGAPAALAPATCPCTSPALPHQQAPAAPLSPSTAADGTLKSALAPTPVVQAPDLAAQWTTPRLPSGAPPPGVSLAALHCSRQL